MKQEYILIFGKHPELSLAEVVSVCGSESIQRVSRECAVVELPHGMNAALLQKRLGGVIKIGEVVAAAPHDSILNTMEELLRKDKKTIFGISVYSLDESVRLRPLLEKTQRMGIDLKKKFREEGNRSRFAVSKEQTLSSVAVVKNKLLSEGIEILVLADKERVTLGTTMTVQDFEEYNRRDYGRPKPSPRSGMLPPKVAQMMINLSQVKPDQTLLDPFCGSGTVLQEAAFLGVQHLIGTDRNPETVDDAKQNLDWFQKTFNVHPSSLRLSVCDVRTLLEKIPPQSVDAIVTEPYLGPPLTGRETAGELQKNTKDLEGLYADAFREFARIMKPGGVVTIIFPRFQKGAQRFEIQIFPQIQKHSFRVDALFAGLESLALPFRPNPRGSVVYQREDQYVAREIFRFKKI